MVRMFAILCTDKRYLSGSYQFVAGNAADRTSTESPMPDVVAFDAGAPFQQVSTLSSGPIGGHEYQLTGGGAVRWRRSTGRSRPAGDTPPKVSSLAHDINPVTKRGQKTTRSNLWRTARRAS